MGKDSWDISSKLSPSFEVEKHPGRRSRRIFSWPTFVETEDDDSIVAGDCEEGVTISSLRGNVLGVLCSCKLVLPVTSQETVSVPNLGPHSLSTLRVTDAPVRSYQRCSSRATHSLDYPKQGLTVSRRKSPLSNVRMATDQGWIGSLSMPRLCQQ